MKAVFANRKTSEKTRVRVKAARTQELLRSASAGRDPLKVKENCRFARCATSSRQGDDRAHAHYVNANAAGAQTQSPRRGCHDHIQGIEGSDDGTSPETHCSAGDDLTIA